ncbi:LuxR C-terminal-related transcriptional regulator [Kitasatospora cheerisanensis]|uniref:HTH luxR-type domain-containing protein n=1 Tax=Kitasatospora cheerisanensis KCTC 2395 TaxID=1348663 RepID=A0A066YT25_9ACTN|nr:LuxR C-terminal-related transcriptional regulator [Kitasatospora cheerisanensis]KDN84402.1 hypothetical protein KCH_41930 [Kitasatospora cheerisanensis KCTC 2395]
MTIPLYGQPLEPREVEILARLARGHRYADIALDVYGGLNSVKTSLHRTFLKLGAVSGPHAVALAIATGALPADVAQHHDHEEEA